ncbi:MAG: glycoside hydrolase family 65 protein [Chloroflexi bacterium]|nr:glycoside hydrolase family 65 protein [Chloroflexota bacterium]
MTRSKPDPSSKMAGRASPPGYESAPGSLLPQLARSFNIIAFDWDGTAVMSRLEDATPVRQRLEPLLQFGVQVVVITGTNFGNIDRQLSAVINGPHKRNLYICTNRGSEVYSFDEQSQPVLLWKRIATPLENQLLTDIADRVRETLQARSGLDIQVIYRRLNRRKIDLIPLPQWRNPPKEVIDELLEAVQQRLKGAGVSGGLHEVFDLTKTIAREKGLPGAHITSDVKHIEIGLTDKSDSIDWVMTELATRLRVSAEDVLIGGDEFGPIAGFEGSDHKMVTPIAKGATFVSVGKEPGGTPPEVINLGGGPSRFLRLLDDQINLHEQGRLVLPFVPGSDPNWLLVEQGFTPAREHEVESLLTIGNGCLGTRGSIAEDGTASLPATFIAGVFDATAKSTPFRELVLAPDWVRMRIVIEGDELRLDSGKVLEHWRILDMRQGVLIRDWRHRDLAGRITHVQTLRFASLADRHTVVESVALSAKNYTGRISLRYLIDGRVRHTGGAVHLAPVLSDGTVLAMRTLDSGIVLAFAIGGKMRDAEDTSVTPTTETGDAWIEKRWEWDAEIGKIYVLDKLVTVHTSREDSSPIGEASKHLVQMEAQGADTLLVEQQSAWASRWRAADVEFTGDDEAQRALRFAGYHLISAANPDDGLVSIGARGFTGEAYKGHVFWDTDIFMLPFYVFTYPQAARALLMYRYHTLAAARTKAQAMGYRGALYAWESADTGEETAPLAVVDPHGNVVKILSGQQEQHISADVAYAIWQYWQATGDDQFFRDAGAEVILETARFWASRAIKDQGGLYHIRGVIGPDEYHMTVDDNAYTNMMAKWNLERGAETASILQKRWPDEWAQLVEHLNVGAAEPEQWVRVADNLYTGFDPATGLFEQFAGYFALEDIDLASYTPRTAPMDVLLGRSRVQASQVAKQADVIMLIFLLWDQFPPRVREANFRYYEPRTDHGSSLSPAIHALVAARLNDLALAQRYFRQAAEIDLADNMGNGAMGVHLGALGGLWQATVLGFAGARMRQDGLSFDPHLLPEWRTLRFPLQWRGRHLRITIAGKPLALEVTLEEGDPIERKAAPGFTTIYV